MGLTLAATAPNLIGAVACLDFGLSEPLIKAVIEPEEDTILPENLSSSQILPWWSFWIGQGGKFPSPAECAGFLLTLVTNFGPVSFLKLLEGSASSVASSSSGIPSETSEESQLELQKSVLAALARPPAAAAADAVTMLCPVSTARTATRSGTGSSSSARFIDDDFPEMEFKMDPKFFFNFDISTMVRQIAALKTHVLVIHGERSSMVSSLDASALARLPKNPACSTVVQVPQTGHHLLTDAPNQVYDAIVNFLEGPAVRCFEIGTGGKDSRRPEALGIRPLPEYASIEEAKKALGPRAVPTAAAVEDELRKLRIEAGEEDSDEEESTSTREGGRTALAQDPPDYFGFVG